MPIFTNSNGYNKLPNLVSFDCIKIKIFIQLWNDSNKFLGNSNITIQHS